MQAAGRFLQEHNFGEDLLPAGYGALLIQTTVTIYSLNGDQAEADDILMHLEELYREENTIHTDLSRNLYISQVSRTPREGGGSSENLPDTHNANQSDW